MFTEGDVHAVIPRISQFGVVFLPMSDVVDDAQEAVSEAADHPLVERAARFGYAANAVMHAIIGLLAIKLAFGQGVSADQGGVLQVLVQSTGGKVLVGFGVFSWAALAFWQVGEACLSFYSAKTRLKAVAKALTYAVLSILCVLTLVRGQSASSKEQNVSTTAKLMEHSAGVALVVAVGVIIVAVGAYHVVKGAKKRFHEDLVGQQPQWVEHAGVVGYILKGLALVATGIFFANAGLTNDPSDAGGLDAALHKLLEKPFGALLVGAIGLGFAIFGIYSAARSRYAKV